MRLFCMLGLLAIGASISGCAKPPRIHEPRKPQSARLLFGPDESSPPPLPYETDWPATVAVDDISEVVYYRESFFDFQSSRPYRHESPYRRFESVRVGRGLR